METKFSKEYAKKLAKEYTVEYGGYESDYVAGYMKALRESAAPDLLEALQSVRPYLAAAGTNGNHWLPTVDEAIKKATE